MGTQQMMGIQLSYVLAVPLGWRLQLGWDGKPGIYPSEWIPNQHEDMESITAAPQELFLIVEW